MITENTTLADLTLLRAQFGVVTMHLELKDRVCCATLVTAEHRVVGTSRKDAVLPEIEALDDAFARLCHLIGASIAVDGAKTGQSNRWSL